MSKTLKERRKALGLRLEDVLKMLDPNVSVSYGSLWNYENSRPGDVIMSKYQAVLDLYDRLEKERANTQEEKETC
jgi:hypothetical protein